jgi:hypothetical protein
MVPAQGAGGAVVPVQGAWDAEVLWWAPGGQGSSGLSEGMCLEVGVS